MTLEACKGPAGGGVASKKSSKAPAGADRGLFLTQAEIIALRRTLEGVMTLASHGILFRIGQQLGERVAVQAKAKGGSFEDECAKAVAEAGWAKTVQFFPAKVQVFGSLEVEPGATEPTCHLLRGVLQRVLSESRGAIAVREMQCSSAGAPTCVFEAQKGGHAQ